MSHVKFNVDLVRALIKKGTRFTPKEITTIGAFISNLKGLHYFYVMDRSIKDKKVVWCVQQK